MKRLPDGAQICAHRKIVTCIANGSIFIEEADRSAGIKVEVSGHYPPELLAPGDLVTFTGVMGTSDTERIIYTSSDLDCDMSTEAGIGSLGMSDAAIQGWPVTRLQPDGPRSEGLMPYGLLVRIWGKVTAKGMSDEDGAWYVYLDDGWKKRDGTLPGYTGIRVYCDRVPGPDEPMQVAVGVCTSRTYDPTPFGPAGDEFAIPIVRTTSLSDMFSPVFEPVAVEFGTASGRVRLIGQSTPGVDVRVYTQYESIVLHNVTDDWVPFSLSRVPQNGLKVSACTPGYLAETRDIAAGSTDADLALGTSNEWVEITTGKTAIRSCSSETSVVTAMARDCEGKGLPGRQIRLTTTMGSFVDSGAKQIIVTTGPTGFASVLLTANPDGAGVATIRAEAYPTPSGAAQTQVVLTGPEIAVRASVLYMAQPAASNITAHLAEGGGALANEPVTFRTDHGLFEQSGTTTYTTTTNADGDAAATLYIAGPGTARVLATHTNQCSHATVGWAVVTYKSAPWYAVGAQFSHPAIADLDGAPDGKKEVVIVTSLGNLSVLNAQGQIIWSKTMHPQGSNTVALAPMDADRSGLPCVFLGAENQQKCYAFAHDGSTLAGWPTGSNYRFIRVAPSVADANCDGTLEIVAGDECCYVFSWNPTGDWKATGTSDSSFLWRNLTGTPSTAIYGSTCAVGDVGEPEGIPDVIVGTNHAPEVYGFQGDLWGDFMSSPRYLGGWPKSGGGRVGTSPAIGDIDGDGKNDVAVGGDSGCIYLWLSSDLSWTGYQTGSSIRSSPALCDLNGDGRLDVVFGSDAGRVYAINWLGHALSGWAGGIRLNSTGSYPVESPPVAGDVNGDGRVEVVVGCSDGNVYALYNDGLNHLENGLLTGPVAWVRCCVPPAESSATILTSPAIDDVDNDGLVEVVVGSDKGIYLIHLNAPYAQNPDLYPWPTFHHDNRRTGLAGPQPPPNRASIQGIVTQGGSQVPRAKVYITHNDGSPVYVPYSDPPVARGFVYSVGTTDLTETGRGCYCISQLEPNLTYKLRVVLPDLSEHWVPDVAVTTGLLRLDLAF